MKLDKSKSYAQIIGSDDGSRFEQGGVIFDANENAMNQPKVVENIPAQVIIDAPKKRGPKPKVRE